MLVTDINGAQKQRRNGGNMKQSSDLSRMLRQIDRKSYPAYKQLRDEYQFPSYVLSIDHVQGDPFAAPSKVSIHIK